VVDCGQLRRGVEAWGGGVGLGRGVEAWGGGVGWRKWAGGFLPAGRDLRRRRVVACVRVGPRFTGLQVGLEGWKRRVNCFGVGVGKALGVASMVRIGRKWCFLGENEPKRARNAVGGLEMR
jgi:hypothetical protein